MRDDSGTRCADSCAVPGTVTSPYTCVTRLAQSLRRLLGQLFVLPLLAAGVEPAEADQKGEEERDRAEEAPGLPGRADDQEHDADRDRGEDAHAQDPEPELRVHLAPFSWPESILAPPQDGGIVRNG